MYDSKKVVSAVGQDIKRHTHRRKEEDLWRSKNGKLRVYKDDSIRNKSITDKQAKYIQYLSKQLDIDTPLVYTAKTANFTIRKLKKQLAEK